MSHIFCINLKTLIIFFNFTLIVTVLTIELNTNNQCKEYLDDNIEYILCTGINLTTYDEIDIKNYHKDYHSDVRLENCTIPIIPKNFFKYFIFVGYLKIHNCNIEKFHQLSFDNSHLYTLSLKNNLIKYLPSGQIFNSMNFLKLFDLTNNLIENINDTTFNNMKNLEKLYLRKNHIKKINITTFQELNKLIILDLSDNYIELIDDKSFDQNINLKSLLLSNNHLKIFNDIQLGCKQTLEYLDLSINPLKFVKFSIISDIKFLNLSNTKLLGSFDYDTFIKIPLLQILDLSNNQLQKIDTHLFYPLRALRKLYLNGNNLNEIDYEDAKFDPIELDITNNNWNCTYLHKMIKYLNSQSINLYLPIGHKPNNIRNIAGIGCNDYNNNTAASKSDENYSKSDTKNKNYCINDDDDDNGEINKKGLKNCINNISSSFSVNSDLINLISEMNLILIFMLIIVFIYVCVNSIWKIIVYKRYYGTLCGNGIKIKPLIEMRSSSVEEF